MFIETTSFYSGDKILINVNQILSIVPNEKETVLQMVDDHTYILREDYETVLTMIAKTSHIAR